MLTALRRIQPFPFLFAYAWIVGIFALGSSPLAHLVRPLLLAMVAVALTMLPVVLIARGRRGTQIPAGVAALLLATAWPFAAAVGIIGLWGLVIGRLQERGATRTAPSTDGLLRVANGSGLAIAAVVTVNAMLSGGLVASDPPPLSDRPVPLDGAPNIHVVLLDGYPRADTLQDEFDFNNAPFTSALERHGFEVADRSRSNYSKTIVTLASFLHMDYVDAIPALRDTGGSAVEQDRRLTRAINDGAALAQLREHGYEIVSSAAAFGESSLLAADRIFDTAGLTRFEEQLLRFTGLATLLEIVAPDAVMDAHRRAVHQSFENWVDYATSNHDRPYFMLTHVLAPHSPFLVAPDGSHASAPPCFPRRCALWDTELRKLGLTPAEHTAGVRAQIELINTLVLDAVADVRRADPTGVIVLFSDHGLRYDVTSPDEFFRNFVAVDVPLQGVEPLPDDTSPVNILPYVFNAVLDTNLPHHGYAGWLSDDEPLDLSRFEAQSGSSIRDR